MFKIGDKFSAVHVTDVSTRIVIHSAVSGRVSQGARPTMIYPTQTSCNLVHLDFYCVQCERQLSVYSNLTFSYR